MVYRRFADVVGVGGRFLREDARFSRRKGAEKEGNVLKFIFELKKKMKRTRLPKPKVFKSFQKFSKVFDLSSTSYGDEVRLVYW